MKLFFLTVPILFVMTYLHSDPWGKDASLCASARSHIMPSGNCKTILLGPLSESLIRFHQEVISPTDGPRSHYFPSSSNYTKEAIRKFGFFQGFCLGCDRLLRENSEEWVYRKVKEPNGQRVLKWDPVR